MLRRNLVRPTHSALTLRRELQRQAEASVVLGEEIDHEEVSPRFLETLVV